MQIVRRIADAIELGEDQIPDLNRLAVVKLVVDFATRTANPIGSLTRSGSGPEVFVFIHARDATGGEAYFFVPNLGRLVIVFVDGHRETVGIEGQPFFVGKKLPRPLNRFLLEVIAEAEIPKHFKEGVVVRRAPDIVDVPGPEALLASRSAREVEFDFPQKVVLELIHPGGSEQDRGVPSRDENVAGLAMVPFGLEESQILFA